jgi:hypothetical protein
MPSPEPFALGRMEMFENRVLKIISGPKKE